MATHPLIFQLDLLQESSHIGVCQRLGVLLLVLQVCQAVLQLGQLLPLRACNQALLEDAL